MTESRSLSLVELRDAWTRIAGPLVGAVSWPRFVTGAGELIVEAGTPTWLDRLQERGPELVATLPAIDGNVITSVRFVYAPPTRGESRESKLSRYRATGIEPKSSRKSDPRGPRAPAEDRVGSSLHDPVEEE